MTDEMLESAHRSTVQAGVGNVEFLKGHPEELPLPDESVDVVISNPFTAAASSSAKMRALKRLAWTCTATSPTTRCSGRCSGLASAGPDNELLRDVAVRITPLNEAHAHHLVRSLRSFSAARWPGRPSPARRPRARALLLA